MLPYWPAVRQRRLRLWMEFSSALQSAVSTPLALLRPESNLDCMYLGGIWSSKELEVVVQQESHAIIIKVQKVWMIFLACCHEYLASWIVSLVGQWPQVWTEWEVIADISYQIKRDRVSADNYNHVWGGGLRAEEESGNRLPLWQVQIQIRI